MKISLVTPYRCNICGYESNNEDQIKHHMRAWADEHKVIRAKSKSKRRISVEPLRMPAPNNFRAVASKRLGQ